MGADADARLSAIHSGRALEAGFASGGHRVARLLCRVPRLCFFGAWRIPVHRFGKPGCPRRRAQPVRMVWPHARALGRYATAVAGAASSGRLFLQAAANIRVRLLPIFSFSRTGSTPLRTWQMHVRRSCPWLQPGIQILWSTIFTQSSPAWEFSTTTRGSLWWSGLWAGAACWPA
jgi:hypothetical protein